MFYEKNDYHDSSFNWNKYTLLLTKMYDTRFRLFNAQLSIACLKHYLQRIYSFHKVLVDYFAMILSRRIHHGYKFPDSVWRFSSIPELYMDLTSAVGSSETLSFNIMDKINHYAAHFVQILTM